MPGATAQPIDAPSPDDWSDRFRHLLPVHTTVPGRARFRVDALYRAEQLKDQIEARLRELDGVRSAKVNILTASLVVHFDPAVSHPELAASIDKEFAELSLPRQAPSPPQGQPNGLTDALSRAWEAFKGAPDHQGGDSQTHSRARQNPPPAANDSWHALDCQTVLARVEGTEQGLSDADADQRLARYGPNALPQAARRSDLSLLLEQILSPPVALLGVSAVVSVFTGGLIEAVSIVGVVVVNTVIGFFTERQSERTISSLAPMRPRQVAVLREGTARQIPVQEVVTGDVVLLAPGSYVAADARLLEAENLTVDESALTGESMPVEKNADFQGEEDTTLGDRLNMIYMGTMVTGGSGNAMVVGTGLNTEIGRIQSLAEEAQTPETPMERQLDELGHQLAWLSSAICGGVFVVGLLRGYGWLEMLKASISLAVAAVPEGLPMVATTTLALGIRKMQQRHVLVRRLDAVETLGSVQFFCFDKTGTLTMNRMSVVALHAQMQRIQIEEGRFLLSGKTIEPQQTEEIRRLCQVAALCNEVDLNGESEEIRLNGSATEKALVELALDAGLDVRKLRKRHPQLDIQHRAEDRPYMVTIHPGEEESKQLIAVKGSPEHMIELCKTYQQDGELHPLDDDARKAILQENERMAGEALRVLGVAYAIGDEGQQPLDSHELIWLGLAGMADPLRPGMDELVRRFHQAGINTAMITGDQSATAYAIAKQLDLAEGQSVEILDSASLNKIDPDLLSGVVQRVQVFARVSPSHKLQIVQALQQAGKVVAMTGDGINDGPALKAADLGVAMGGAGTDVARSLANIVLEDDNLATMEVAVQHGRTIYGNVRKAIHFLLSTNLSEIETMLIGIALGFGQPLNPMQLLWINLITDIFPGLALALEPPEPEIMNRPPRDPKEPIVSTRDLRRLGVESAVITTGTLASYGYAFLRYGPGARANTHAFMSLTLAQLLHALSCRSDRHTILERDGLPSNPYLNIALGASAAVQALTIFVPGLRRILGTTPVSLVDGLVMGAGAAVPLLINETRKKLSITDRQTQRHQEKPDNPPRPEGETS